MAERERRGPSPRRARGGLVGLYALHRMATGPIYGWQLARDIGEVTRGGWTPGAGAIYPILQGLVRRGLARTSVRGGRKVYRATAQGRARLARARRWLREGGTRWVNLRYLVLELIPPEERDAWALRLLEGQLDGFLSLLRDPSAFPDPAQRERLMRAAARAIERTREALAPAREGPRRQGGSRRRSA
ncbi:MAG: helix-turn-helix transcriptional regulator [Thermoplasmata archaeon]